ncbi:hypothetical protein THASP1DRAFT_30118 [Thamnocephalis sphaerospora]|uniref:DH domain-containing protein n=1 Tax=Thamnocephalis sphaerospora TaxID=78915 RepID=A0A4P9XRW1_9FUNG|nr:hypothetical protein THASP1DRAFT_30118 [Thamnocephalis sphaerospora]|eukprot:RKP08070.1 hypothetical protein THASP1DRAFT_30118 [Thamnocephalis sphaerospora]
MFNWRGISRDRSKSSSSVNCSSSVATEECVSEFSTSHDVSVDLSPCPIDASQHESSPSSDQYSRAAVTSISEESEGSSGFFSAESSWASTPAGYSANNVAGPSQDTSHLLYPSLTRNNIGSDSNFSYQSRAVPDGHRHEGNSTGSRSSRGVRGWPYLETPMNKSGLLYCDNTGPDGLVSATNHVSTSILTAIGALSKPVATGAIASSFALERPVRFGGNYKQLEDDEAVFVAQLEYMRDYYMRPLLGKDCAPTMLSPPETEQRPKRLSRFRVKSLSKLLPRRKSAANTRSSDGSSNGDRDAPGSTASQLSSSWSQSTFTGHSTSSGHASSSGTFSTDSSVSNVFVSNTARAQGSIAREDLKQSFYNPLDGTEKVISAPFSSLFKLIELHTRFLMALKRERPLDGRPEVVTSLLLDHVPRLSCYYKFAYDHPMALCKFETLVFLDKQLAKAIEIRDDASPYAGLRALLFTVPVSRIWYYGGVLRSIHRRMGNALPRQLLNKLELCLRNLEKLARHLWPIMHHVANMQRVALMQRNLAGLKRTLMTPTQQIHHLDTLEFRVHEDTASWCKASAILLSDRLLLLREKGGRNNRFTLRMGVFFAESTFTFTKKLFNSNAGGFYVHQPHHVDIQLRIVNKEALQTWRHLLAQLGTLDDAASMASRARSKSSDRIKSNGRSPARRRAATDSTPRSRKEQGYAAQGAFFGLTNVMSGGQNASFLL